MASSVARAYRLSPLGLGVEVQSPWSSGVARGGFGGSTPPPLKNVKKISEDKIVEKTQRWSLHVLYRHQTTLFAETKVT